MRLRRLLLPALTFALLVAPLGAQGGVPPVGPLAGGAQVLDDGGSNFPPRAAMRSDQGAVVVWADLPSGGVDLGDTPIGAAATITTTGLLYRLLDGRGRPQGQIEEAGAPFVQGYAVASDAVGNFAIAWEGDDEILLRRFRADGTPADQEPVEITTGGGLREGPDVTLDRAGNATVAWARLSAEDTTTVNARALGAGSVAPGELITVTSVLSATVNSLSVSAGDRGFVVAWGEHLSDLTGYTLNSRVVASTFDAGAAPRSTTVVASFNGMLSTFSSLTGVDAAMAPDGRFVVGWLDGRTGTILAQPFGPNGEARGSRVTLSASSFLEGPSLAIDGAANFTLAYNQGYPSYEILARRYTADGVAVPPDFGVANAGSSPHPAVAANADGEFVVAWRASGTIYGQLFRRPAVEVEQTAAGEFGPLETVVAEGGRDDLIFVGLRTRPPGPVTVTLTPTDGQVSLGLLDDDLQGAQAGSPLRIPFEGESAGRQVPVRVTAVDDRDAEGTHLARITVAAEGPGTGYDSAPLLLLVDGEPTDAVTATVLDNDFARYAVSSNTAGTTEGSGQPVVFTVSRSGAVDGRSAVAYSFVGTARFGPDGDYTASGPAGPISATGVITFTAGERERALRLTIIDDPLGEPLKTIGLQLTGAVPEGAGSLSFPLALVALGDNDLAEVRIAQTGGSTVVRRGEPPDMLAIALRTIPAHPVEVTLTPTDRRLSVGLGYGVPLRLTFAADQSALQQQWVEVSTLPAEGGAASLAANAGIGMAARSQDPGYDRGARFTVDGRDLGTIPVDVVTRPGENPNPPVPSAYLPLLVR